MRYGTWKPLPRYVNGVKKWDLGRATGTRMVLLHRPLGTLPSIYDWHSRAASGTVSVHFGIGYASWYDRVRDRVSVHQYVDTTNTAYGTAVTRYPVSRLAQNVLGDVIGRLDVNHALIHIEVEGMTFYSPWPPSFTRALNGLLSAIAKSHGRVILGMHHDLSSKNCPGPMVPWSQIPNGYGRPLGVTQAPAPSLTESVEMAILSKILIPGDVGRMFDCKAGVTLRKGPGTAYPYHWKTTVPVKYRLVGFSPNGWVAAANPNDPTGVFFVPPVH